MSSGTATCRLGDPGIAELILGSSPPSTSYNQIGEGLPFYQGKVDFGLVSPTTRVWCRDGIQFADQGDVLVSVRAPVGDVNMATDRCVIGRGIAALRAGPKTVPWFLFFAMQHVQPVLMQRSSGSTFASVNKSTLQDLQIPVFSGEDQESIARVLIHVVTCLEREETASRMAQDVKAGAMRELFTRGLRGEPQKDTEVGLAPASWEVRRLEDDHDIAGGGTPLRSVDAYWAGGTIPWVKTGEVNYSVIRSTEEHITPAGMDNSSARLLPPGTLLIAMFGQGVTRGRVAILGIEATCNQACAAVRPRNDRVDTRFLYHLLTSKYEELRQLAHGGQQQNLNIDIVRNFQVVVPSIRDEQQEIVAILDAIDRKIDLHRRKKAVLEELFRSLLHKLMTGEVRVADLDLSVLPASKEARS